MTGYSDRVAVTGVGMVTSLGGDTESVWARLVAGETGIGDEVPWAADRYATRRAAVVPDEVLSSRLTRKERRRLDRCHALTLLAARAALSDGNLGNGAVDPDRAGLYLGSSLGGMLSGMRYYRQRLASRARCTAALVNYPFHVCLDILYADTGFRGPGNLVATACTASTVAAAQGVEALRSGAADIVLTGGVDPICEFSFAGFAAMQNVSSEPCAPFSEPPGLTLGEGAVFLVLERLDHAEARGADILAEVLGYNLNADAYHPTAPDPSGSTQQRLLSGALAAAGLTPGDIAYVNAHGTGTVPNDATESQAIAAVLGNHAARVAVSSTKGATGHMLGGAGAMELAATVLAVSRETAPPTANFTTVREGCTLDYVPGKGRSVPVPAAVSQNFAFGGNNAALAVCRPGLFPPPPAPEPLVPVITGMGVIAPTGIGRQAFSRALESGETGIRSADDPAFPDTPVHLAAYVDGFRPAKLTRANLRRADRVGQFTVCAAELALADAGLKISRELSERAGICIGTSRGPVESCRAFYHDIALDRPEAANPKLFPNTVLNAGAGLAAVTFRLKGLNVATTVGAASGLHAMALAADLIRTGKADVVLAGGCDELTPWVIEGYAAGRQLSPLAGTSSDEEGLWLHDERCNGMVLGEGCALVVLESRQFAESRGARPIAEVVSTAIAGSPERTGESSARTIDRCLDGDSRVDLILSGALGLAQIDRAEAAAIEGAFAKTARPPIAALAGLFGVSGATPMLSLCAGLVGMENGFMPAGPVRGRPRSGFDMVEGTPRRERINSLIVNGLSEGGLSVSVRLRKGESA